MSRIFQVQARIKSNTVKETGFGHCVVSAPQIARSAQPGQCVNIRISDGLDPLLRRPFGVHRTDGDTISILYEIVGRGTKLLSQKKAGEYLDILGPFGHGFDMRSVAGRRSHPAIADWPVRACAQPVTGRWSPVLVAGGMGVAPLVFLAEALARGPRSAGREPVVLIGGKNRKRILCEREFKEIGCRVKIATDDGSKGSKGYVSDVLDNVLSSMDCSRAVIYACGPVPMLAAVSRLAVSRGIPVQVSLESHMSCGIGACLGCVVKTSSGFKRVCKEGPVFDAREIVWEQSAGD